MPGQALLKATLLKETYVPLVDLNGAERNHAVVRVLPRRLSLLERRFLDLIAPRVFPVREQFNELRQAARLERAGFQVKDVIKVYERLLSASATKSTGYTKVAPVDEEYFEFSPVEPHQLASTPKQRADDMDFDRLVMPVIAGSTPDETLTNYRTAIFDNLMFQLEEKLSESNFNGTGHTTRLNEEENIELEALVTPTTGGTYVGGSENEDEMSEFDDDDSGSLEISFKIPLPMTSPEDISTLMTTPSWRRYLGSGLGCYSKSPSGTSSTPSLPTIGTQTNSSPDSDMAKSVMAAVIQPTVDNNRGKANVTEQSRESVNGESLFKNSDTLRSLRRKESTCSLRKLLLSGNSDAQNSANGRLLPQGFVAPRSSVDEDDDVKGERSLMSILRRTRELNDVVRKDLVQSEGDHNCTDGRHQHIIEVEKSRSGVARVEAREASPRTWSDVSENPPTKLSKSFGKSQSMKGSRALPDADADGRSSPTFLRSRSMQGGTASDAKQDENSCKRGAVPNSIQNSPSRSHGDSQHRSSGRSAPSFLRSLSMDESSVFGATKQEFYSRRTEVPANVPKPSDKFHGNRVSKFFGKGQSMKERTSSTVTKEDFSATSPADCHGSPERPAKQSLGSKTIERFQGMLWRSPQQTTRLQPVVDSTATEKILQESHVDQGTTVPRDEPQHDNTSNPSSLTKVVDSEDIGPVVKRSRPKLGTLIDDARDLESEQLFAVKPCSGCTEVQTLKGILSYRKAIVRIKMVAAWFVDVDWIHKSTETAGPLVARSGEISPKRSWPKRRVTFKSVASTAPEFQPEFQLSKFGEPKHNRSPGRSPSRSVFNEGRSTEASTNKIHPVGSVLEGHPSGVSSAAGALAGNAKGLTDSNYSGDCIRTAKILMHWTTKKTREVQKEEKEQRLMNCLSPRSSGRMELVPLGHRQLRSRSTSSRFLREYIARQEGMVQSQTIVAGG